MMSKTEAQPNGDTVEETLAVVSHVLSDPEFATGVREQNEWIDSLTDEHTAILFLASRYQESVTLLSLRTDTLKRELDGIVTRLVDLEDTDIVADDQG
jgi:hypothetical protein